MPTSPLTLASLTRSQLERLSYIEFRLYFLGELKRADLIDRFGIGPAGATRDIALYREMAPENIEFEGAGKLYVPSTGFKPKFEHPAQRVLTALSQGFGEGTEDNLTSLVPCEFAASLSLPKVDVLAPITRAIQRKKAVRLRYDSVTSGTTERECVPLALVSSGVRWHVRVFDRKSQTFRDFVLTRITSPCVLEDSPVLASELAAGDLQWNRIIELELVPHPSHVRPEITQLDYDMPHGVLRVRMRAANAGYILRHWSVDCSPDHSLRGREYALWLRDPLVLYGAESAVVAPGYRLPSK